MNSIMEIELELIRLLEKLKRRLQNKGGVTNDKITN